MTLHLERINHIINLEYSAVDGYFFLYYSKKLPARKKGNKYKSFLSCELGAFVSINNVYSSLIMYHSKNHIIQRREKK